MISLHRIQNFRRYCLSLSVILSIAFPVFSAEDTLLLVTRNFPPYCIENEERPGFITEIIVSVLQEIGCKYKIKYYPWARCELMVLQGEAWATYPFSTNQQRDSLYWFSSTIGYSTQKFFYYGEKPIELFEKLEDLKGLRIGGVLGYYYNQDFSDANLSVEYTHSEILGLKKLYTQRIDLISFNEIIGWRMISEQYPSEEHQFGTLEMPLREIELKMMVSKRMQNSEVLLQKFNTALARFKKSETYIEILSKYHMKPSQYHLEPSQ